MSGTHAIYVQNICNTCLKHVWHMSRTCQRTRSMLYDIVCGVTCCHMMNHCGTGYYMEWHGVTRYDDVWCRVARYHMLCNIGKTLYNMYLLWDKIRCTLPWDAKIETTSDKLTVIVVYVDWRANHQAKPVLKCGTGCIFDTSSNLDRIHEAETLVKCLKSVRLHFWDLFHGVFSKCKASRWETGVKTMQKIHQN